MIWLCRATNRQSSPCTRGGQLIRNTFSITRAALVVALAVSLVSLGTPSPAYAFSLWDTVKAVVQPVAEAKTATKVLSSLSTPALHYATNPDPNPNKGGGDIQMTPDGTALVAETGPAGTAADIEGATAKNGQISLYVVRPGDTLSEIAALFDVTTNTILWANDLKSAKDIHPGDTLVILPIEGVQHKVVKGETLASIVKKYKGDMEEVLAYNGLAPGAKVAIGDELIIPHGVESAAIVTSAAVTSSVKAGSGGPVLAGYYMRPIVGGRKTQGIHGYNGVDLGTPIGTQVMASAGGTITVARAAGYNGGYGSYIVISHPNGTQTLYAHLSDVMVGVGSTVVQGQVIGLSGNSGRSTGAHLHFEVRGAANPF